MFVFFSFPKQNIKHAKLVLVLKGDAFAFGLFLEEMLETCLKGRAVVPGAGNARSQPFPQMPGRGVEGGKRVQGLME